MNLHDFSKQLIFKRLHEIEDKLDYISEKSEHLKAETLDQIRFKETIQEMKRCFGNHLGLLEILAKFPEERDAILNHDGKPSPGSKEFDPKDFI
ncbi:hypothetical protein P3G55_24285 [Leptospira sp. 96542]|nr:hypothetical protein [Leptospira sp. 96542]